MLNTMLSISDVDVASRYAAQIRKLLELSTNHPAREASNATETHLLSTTAVLQGWIVDVRT